MSTDGIRVVIAGGGTGGHFFSGMAVGEAFKAREPSIHIIYVGTERGIEARVGPRLEQRLNEGARHGFRKALIPRLPSKWSAPKGIECVPCPSLEEAMQTLLRT